MDFVLRVLCCLWLISSIYGNNLELRSCEDLTAIPLCTPLEYRSVYYPNPRGHETQEEANTELEDFAPLIQSGCSPYLRHFLCAYYAPLCKTFLPPDLQVPPCRELCVHVYQQCQSLLLSQGFNWPDHLDCSLFPTKANMNWCFGPDDPAQLTNSLTNTDLPSLSVWLATNTSSGSSTKQVIEPSSSKVSTTTVVSSPTSMIFSSNKNILLSTHSQYSIPISTLASSQFSTPVSTPSAPSQVIQHTTSPSSSQHNIATTPPAVLAVTCEPLPSDSLCHNLGYHNITFPNSRGHLSWQEAEYELDQFSLFVLLRCSHHVLHFFCYYYLPECINHTPYPLQPCRELCEEVKRECNTALKNFNLHWPRHINCQTFPSLYNEEQCSMPQERTTTVPPQLTQPTVEVGQSGSSKSLCLFSLLLVMTITLCVLIY